MDDFDLLDLGSPADLVFVAASGVLDDGDDERCACTCGCERAVDWAGDTCDPCAQGRHGNPFDADDRR
jgi:hypothetical protein